MSTFDRDESASGDEACGESRVDPESDSHPEWARSEILAAMLPYSHRKVKDQEEYLRRKTSLGFDYIFSQPTGFYLLTRFAQSDDVDVNRLLFLKDCLSFQKLQTESAREFVARQIFLRYLAPIPKPSATNPQSIKVRSAASKPSVPSSQNLFESNIPRSVPQSVFDAIEDGSLFASNQSATTSRSESEQKSQRGPPAKPNPSAPPSSSSTSGSATPVVPAGGSRTNFVISPRPSLKSPVSMAIYSQETEQLRASPNGLFDEKFEAHFNHEELKQIEPSSKRSSTSRSTSDLNALVSDRSTSALLLSPRNKNAAQQRMPTLLPRRKRGHQRGLSNVEDLNCIELSQEASAYFKRQIDAKQVPAKLFRTVADEVRDYLNVELFSKFINSVFYQQFVQARLLESVKITPNHFMILRTLGAGGFGTVVTVRKMDSGKLYAMKIIRKKAIVTSNDAAMVMLERFGLTLIHSRFVCSLAYAFQDATRLFLVMDLVLGQNLKEHLARLEGRSFSEHRARFHAAEILLGLEAIHSSNMIYRDLKLENVILDELGHCKLCDLGLVTLTTRKKISLYSGTPGYIAPEIVRKESYGTAVDLFSFGVLLFRMLSAKKPFSTASREVYDAAVVNTEPELDPTVFSANALSLLKGLLQKDPSQRIGCGPRGLSEIKEHPFFASIDWGLLEIGCVDPPFVPKRSDIDTLSPGTSALRTPSDEAEIVFPDTIQSILKEFDFVGKASIRSELVAAFKKRHFETRDESASGLLLEPSQSCCVLL